MYMRRREASKMYFGMTRHQRGQLDLGLPGVFAQEYFVPEDTHICDDAYLAGIRQELAGQVHSDGLRLSGRHPHVFNDGDPLSRLVFYLERRRNQVILLLRLLEERASVCPIHPAIQYQERTVILCRFSKIEIERVKLSDADVVSLEVVNIALILVQKP